MDVSRNSNLDISRNFFADVSRNSHNMKVRGIPNYMCYLGSVDVSHSGIGIFEILIG